MAVRSSRLRYEMGAKNQDYDYETSAEEGMDSRFLDPEVKAFIYQQISSFNAFFADDSNMSVLLMDEGSEDTPMVLKLRLSGLGSFVEAEGQGENIFAAVLDAKRRLMETLNKATREAVDAEEAAALKKKEAESSDTGSTH